MGRIDRLARREQYVDIVRYHIHSFSLLKQEMKLLLGRTGRFQSLFIDVRCVNHGSSSREKNEINTKYLDVDEIAPCPRTEDKA
jgi:hypothetical protein